jgi:membrane-bound metal-dependent hydrolase YbcI (DUF457 family)
MTIYEHAMIGINGSLALGLQRRHGWPLVAWAGVAAVLPDFDGLAILFGLQCYAEGHRLWGHNLLVAGLTAAIAAAAVYWTDALTRVQQWLGKRIKAFSFPNSLTETPKRSGLELARISHHTGKMHNSVSGGADIPVCRKCRDFSGRQECLPHRGERCGLGLWLVVGVVAAYSHLLADVAFSIGNGQPIWGVPLLWPFSDKAYAYPLLRWGDIGATLIFAASMFAMLRWPTRIQAIAVGSLIAVAGYIVVRGFCL